MQNSREDIWKICVLHVSRPFHYVFRVYSRGGQLDQLQEPHFTRPQSARAMSYSCAQRLTSIFGATYSCESLSLCSVLTLIKSKHCPVLSDELLTEFVRAALMKRKIIIILKTEHY
jgi:hypothetical protein